MHLVFRLRIFSTAGPRGLVRLAWIAIAASLSLLAVSAAVEAQELLDGEFGPLNLECALVATDHVPTIRELRKIVSRPRIETVLLLKLHHDKNNHYLPIWSDDGFRLAFQRSDVGSRTSKLLLFQSLSASQPILLTDVGNAYDHMFRWAVNSPSSYVFARTTQDTKSTQIYFSQAGEPAVAKTRDAGRHVYPTLYKRTDGIWRLVYEHDGQLIHDAWKETEEVESGKLLGRGSLPRWDRSGIQLLIARERGKGRPGAYDLVIRNLRSEKEIALPLDATDDAAQSVLVARRKIRVLLPSQVGRGSSMAHTLAPVPDVQQVRDLGEQVVVNMDFESPGPAWESTDERIWFFSHARHTQAYYPLLAVDVKTGATMEVDYPNRCTTPTDIAINPTADIPELAFVAHDGLTQDLFVVLLSHY